MTQRDDAARRLVRLIQHELHVSQRQLALIIGRDQRTVYNYVNEGVIPESTAFWLDQVQEISLAPGRAVLVLGMPPDTPTSEYRRFPSKDDERRPKRNAP